MWSRGEHAIEDSIQDSSTMGLLQGLLQARKLLLVICVPLLLLPLPTIYPTSVSGSLPIPARASVGVGDQKRKV